MLLSRLGVAAGPEAIGDHEEVVMLMPPIDVAVLIRDVNESNEAVEDQCLRAASR